MSHSEVGFSKNCAPYTVWYLMASNSSRVRSSVFFRMASETPTLPMSWSMEEILQDVLEVVHFLPGDRVLFRPFLVQLHRVGAHAADVRLRLLGVPQLRGPHHLEHDVPQEQRPLDGDPGIEGELRDVELLVLGERDRACRAPSSRLMSSSTPTMSFLLVRMGTMSMETVR